MLIDNDKNYKMDRDSFKNLPLQTKIVLGLVALVLIGLATGFLSIDINIHLGGIL